jgi:hypothetical protein
MRLLLACAHILNPRFHSSIDKVSILYLAHGLPIPPSYFSCGSLTNENCFVSLSGGKERLNHDYRTVSTTKSNVAITELEIFRLVDGRESRGAVERGRNGKLPRRGFSLLPNIPVRLTKVLMQFRLIVRDATFTVQP